MILKNRRVLALMCLFSIYSATNSYGQFLEKLENAVRSQLEKAQLKQGDDPSSEELPAPPSKNQLPSILESPLVPTPKVDQSAAPAGQGQIYLGLEAENATGGGLGVRVSDVTTGSPASKAGFRVDDRIIAIDGFALANLDTMVERLSTTSPGQKVEFLIQRSGRNQELTAVLMSAAEAEQQRQGEITLSSGASPWLGVIVSDLTPSFRQQFGLRVFRGAAITEVTSGSPASRAGLRAGDAIVEIDGQPIESGEQVTQAVSQSKPGQTIEMLVYRGIVPKSYQVKLAAIATTQRSPTPSAKSQTAVPNLLNPFGNLFGNNKPPTPTPAPSPEPTERVQSEDPAELKAEIRKLRLELAEARRKLAETEQRVQKILDALK
jgi:predicted metalloprotease with PDZ domain